MLGNRLPNSFTLVPGTAPSTWQMPIVGGSFLQPSCNVFPHVPFKFTFQTAPLFGVGELGRQRLQALWIPFLNVLWPPTPVGGSAGGRKHGLWWEAVVLVIE